MRCVISKKRSKLPKAGKFAETKTVSEEKMQAVDDSGCAN
jgi:hypothetical protein